MTDQELMQQALYALEYASDMTKPENMSGCECPICVTITALRERLEQPEPVPVWELQEDGWDTICDGDWLETLPVGTKLYTTPPQRPWVGLTEPERLSCYDLNPARFASNIEAKLQSKNT